jgi:hypothetical protein
MADKPKTLADVLAKELGYKSAKELKDKIQSGGGGLKGRLESGEGISEAVKGSISDIKEDVKRAASPKRFGKRVYMEMFKGDDIISAYMRGRLNKGKKDKLTDEDTKKEDDGLGGGDATTYLKIIAKNALSFHMMSRDLNVLRQNIVKLTKIEAKAYNKDKKKKDQVEAREGADRFFLKEDEREAKLESERQKYSAKPTQIDAEGKEKKTGGGLLDTVMGFFKGGIFSGLKSIINPSAILKILGKVFVIATIFISLFKGITAAFDKWKETGSLKEAIISGLGAIVDFLTFGLFGEDSIRSLFDSVSNFLDPIINTISGVITSMKDWVVNNFGIPKISFGSIKNPITGTVYSLGSIGPYYPFKSNPRSEEPEVTKKEDKKVTEGQGGKSAEAPASAPPASPSAASGQAKTIEKVGGTSLKLPNGVSYDSAGGNFNYKGITFNADNQKELDLKVGAIDKGSIVEYQGNDRNIGPATITFNGATGEHSLAAPKEAGGRGVSASATLDINATPASQPTAEGMAPTGGGATSPTPAASSGGDVPAGNVSMPSGGGESASMSVPSGGGTAASLSATPTEEGVPGPISGGGMKSGADLAAASQEIAEEQRMESSADMGSMINAPTTNNSQSSSGEAPSKLPDVYDNTLALMLARA